MKSLARLLISLLLLCGSAWANPYVLGRGHSTEAVTRVYLVNLDFEGSPNWDASSGTQDCNLDDVGDICDQSSDYANSGSYSFGLTGDTTYYGAKYLSGTKGELYIDFWMYFTPGKGTYRIALYDSTNTNYVVSIYYYASASSLYIYNNGGDTLDTGVDVTAGEWEHIRLYWKRDTDDTDGVIKFWFSTTDTDFDGDTPTYSNTAVDTADLDAGYVRCRGMSNLAGYKIYYDDVQVWEPDGNE